MGAGLPAKARLPGALVRFFSIAPVTVAMMRLATSIDRPLMRISGGRLRLSFVIPVLLLECIGARTGTLRRVPLLYVPDGPDGRDCLVVASNAGRSRDPAWALNLRAEPRVTALLGGERVRFRAVELDGEPLAAAWRKASAFYRGYDAYSARAGRRIPVFKLEHMSQ